jgi:hypothetical protein
MARRYGEDGKGKICVEPISKQWPGGGMVGGVGNSWFHPTPGTVVAVRRRDGGWGAVGTSWFHPSPLTPQRSGGMVVGVGNSLFHPLPLATQRSEGGLKGGVGNS